MEEKLKRYALSDELKAYLFIIFNVYLSLKVAHSVSLEELQVLSPEI